MVAGARFESGAPSSHENCPKRKYRLVFRFMRGRAQDRRPTALLYTNDKNAVECIDDRVRLCAWNIISQTDGKKKKNFSRRCTHVYEYNNIHHLRVYIHTRPERKHVRMGCVVSTTLAGYTYSCIILYIFAQTHTRELLKKKTVRRSRAEGGPKRLCTRAPYATIYILRFNLHVSLVFVHFWEYNSQTSVYLKFRPIVKYMVVCTVYRYVGVCVRRWRWSGRVNFLSTPPPPPRIKRNARRGWIVAAIKSDSDHKTNRIRFVIDAEKRLGL